ncbi:hypothetical protein DV736_g5117, partial [Chaetothyriales sp. CBS 134916]
MPGAPSNRGSLLPAERLHPSPPPADTASTLPPRCHAATPPQCLAPSYPTALRQRLPQSYVTGIKALLCSLHAGSWAVDGGTMVNPPALGNNGSAAATSRQAQATQSRMGAAQANMAPPAFPYSARRADELKLSTVERKGHASTRNVPPRTRPYALQEAPTFRPTEAEFRDPMAYIKSIFDEGRKYGICKIVPPDSWNPDFAIDTTRFHFRTRRQEINMVEGGNRTNVNYIDQLSKFHQQLGNHFNRLPSVDKRPLDLYKLKKAVEVRGGFEKVCKDKKWAEIGRDLGYSGKIMSSLSTSLKNSYQRWLYPYEEWLKAGGITYFTGVKRSSHIVPTRTAAAASAINTTSAFTAVNQASAPAMVKSENLPGLGFTTVNAPLAGLSQAARNGSPMPNGSFNRLKRTMSHESINGDSGSEALDGESGRRSKRPKKDAGATIPGTHIPAMRPSTPQTKGRSTPRKQGEKCERCGKAEDRANIVVCDTCDLGWHRACVEPALATIPEHEWHCSKCLVGTNDYGFEEGSVYSLKVFQEKANNFKERHFAAIMAFDPVTNTQRRPTEDDVEREFWRLVEDINDPVEVEYGADIHSTTHGSGFPTVEKNPLNRYSKDPWNLNVMPFLEESLFRHIKGDISGMTVPWLYVGMCFSTFCWHNEDHYAYSANYQHFGATKTWYGIPGEDAYAFEAAMKKAVPELFDSQPDLLFQLVTILPPDQLKKAGVRVYALDQRAGEFVITFPQAYHAGFNHGFNFNEAVNFAPVDWEPFGEAGVLRLRDYRRQPCFCHDELLLTAAAADPSIKTARWLAPALQRTLKRELRERDDFVAKHKALHPHDNCTFDTLAPDPADECALKIEMRNIDLEEDEYQCHFCKAFSHLGQFRCKTSGKVSCLLHPDSVECCDETAEQRLRGPNHVLYLRHTNDELQRLVQKVVDRATVPETWEKKLDDLLNNEAEPSLRTMHTLLTEGEKIPYQLSGLQDLRIFVKECDAWVEEANLYLTRKQQNRRKNEKAWRRSSVRAGKDADRDAEPALTMDRMKELLDDGAQLSFSAPQLDALHEKLDAMEEWRLKAKPLCAGRSRISTEELETLLEEGRGFMATIPELAALEKVFARQQWLDEARAVHEDVQSRTLDDCKALCDRATELEIDPRVADFLHMAEIVRQGEFWEIKAKEVMAADDVHFPQLESLYSQVQGQTFPVNKDTLAEMDGLLAKNREAKRQIITLVEKSHDPDFRKRPFYVHVRDVVKSLEDLNGKPHGTADLEKELRRHEDWMRKGKKLFGKANAPLHILEQHMKYVEEKNSFCFDLSDTFRPPVEPASREASPVEGREKGTLGADDEKPVFCICRQPEAGLMIECENCHDWYHAKCLKLARGKVKETEKFTCPICDWRVKIPRDAARPKLEDLQSWQDEISALPFQPEEEDLLKRIVDKAQAFRHFLSQYTNGNQLCRTMEEMPEMLFYLRKIEGAEVLLAYETNVFRQELHKWQGIAPEPPPILAQSLSTRKPRPTKQQKLMKELGVERPEDLPSHLRTKTYSRRKTQDSFASPSTATLAKHGDQQSPAAGPSSSAGSNHGLPTSDTPSALPPDLSADTAPSDPGFGSTLVGDRPNAAPSFAQDYPRTTSRDYTANSPSPLFSPSNEGAAGFRDGETRHQDPSFPLFRPSGLGIDGDDDIQNGLAVGAAAGAVLRASDSPATGTYGNIFMEDGAEREDEPAASLEHETNHASEALEIIASNDDDHREEDGAMEAVNKDFDDFLDSGDD